MKSPSILVLLVAAWVVLIAPSSGYAADAGATDGSAPAEAGTGGAAGGDSSGEGPLGCDGGLCSTVTGGTMCSVALGLGVKTAAPPSWAALLLAAVSLWALRRRAYRAEERAP